MKSFIGNNGLLIPMESILYAYSSTACFSEEDLVYVVVLKNNKEIVISEDNYTKFNEWLVERD